MARAPAMATRCFGRRKLGPDKAGFCGQVQPWPARQGLSLWLLCVHALDLAQGNGNIFFPPSGGQKIEVPENHATWARKAQKLALVIAVKPCAFRQISPESGGIRQSMHCRERAFPAPDGPISTIIFAALHFEGTSVKNGFAAEFLPADVLNLEDCFQFLPRQAIPVV